MRADRIACLLSVSIIASSSILEVSAQQLGSAGNENPLPITQLDPAPCAQGEYPSTISMLGIPGENMDHVVVPPGGRLVHADFPALQAGERNLRIDVCNLLTDTGIAVKSASVLYVNRSGQVVRLNVSGPDGLSSLSEIADFNGDPSRFKLQIPYADGHWLLIQAHKTIKESFFSPALSASLVRVDTSGQSQLSEPEILVGALNYDDPFSLCAESAGGGQPVRAQFELGTAKFEVEYCPIINTAGTRGYQIVSVAVADSHPSLSPSQQSMIEIQGGELAESLRYHVAHHNLCDQFYLKLPHAEYAITSGRYGLDNPEELCREVQGIPAPPQDPQGLKSRYRVRYFPNQWSEARDIDLQHYLFGNSSTADKFFSAPATHP